MKVRADMIKKALAKKHAEDFFMTEVKDGPTWFGGHLRLDAVAIKKSWANPAIIAYEVKVSRSDFRQDEKWPAYLSLCNQFSFVCPKGLITPDELPPEVGLIYYNPESGALYTKRKAQHRLIEEPVAMYKYIIMSRMDSDRHPFFSSRREWIEAYVEDRNERIELGRGFGIKMAGEIHKLRIELERLQDRKDDLKLLNEARGILREHGIWLDCWNQDWKDELRKALAGGMNPRVQIQLTSLLKQAEALKEALGVEV